MLEFLNSVNQIIVSAGILFALGYLNLPRMKDKYTFRLYDSGKYEYLIGFNPYPIYFNLDKHIHLLVAGATGQGKSVFLRNLIMQMLLSQGDINLYLVDFCKVELSLFTGHSRVKCFCDNLTDFNRLLDYFKIQSVKRMEFLKQKKLTNVHEYNRLFPDKKIKTKVVIIDEIATAAQDKNIQNKLLLRIAQDRKSDIHYIICTQRPSVDIITGSMKCNIPARVCFKLPSDADYRTVLDTSIEIPDDMVPGRGIFSFSNSELFQAPYISESETLQLIGG